MFDFLKSKQRKTTGPPSAAPVSGSPPNTTQHGDIKRELIRVVLKDTLRVNGIPFGCLASEVIIITRPPAQDELHIQLVVMQWNEPLLRYASALQQQLLIGLDRIDPSDDHSKCSVSWRFSPDCGCPFTQMPDPSFWLKSTALPVEDEPVPVLDRRHTRRPPNAPALAARPDGRESQPPHCPPTRIAPPR